MMKKLLSVGTVLALMLTLGTASLAAEAGPQAAALRHGHDDHGSGHSGTHCGTFLDANNDGYCDTCNNQSTHDSTGCFADVQASAWYSGAVEYCQSHGLMNGTNSVSFTPAATTTRAMLVTTLYRQAGSPSVAGASAFPDVPADCWYGDAVAWASACGVVNGFSDGTFQPNAPVTREQFTTILWRHAGCPGSSPCGTFADESQISAYAHDAVTWAHGAGIVSGKTGNCFDAHGHTTRAETAQLLYRFDTCHG